MTTYRYQGLSTSGAQIEGVVEAFDQADAVTKARENCRVLINVEPVSAGKVNDLMNADIGTLISGGKIKPKKLALLCSQLGIELKAGLPLVSSLQLVAENEEDKRVKKMLNEVADDVHAGNGLADSFEKRGSFLPKTFLETVRAGEESGKLDECFERLKDYYEKSAAVGSKVKSALVYPAMLLVVAVIVIAIIMIKAVPVFEDSFASMGNTLPAPTRILIATSHFMVDNILIIIAVLLALILAIHFFKKSETGARFFAKLALTFPGIKLVNKMNGASQFCSTLSTMLAAGLPLVQAAKITADVADNILIGEDINIAVEGVIEGNRLGDGLKKSRWLPGLLLEMTAVGEETGKLEETLDVVSEYYTKEVDASVKAALSLLEPVIVIVMAVLVVFILLSVYLPLFSMYGSV